ncbi:NADH-quinone oxidoreductase subunit N [Desulfoplanes sp. PS50]|jgi:NADH-quinone oxidoreductase subunit N
MTNSPMLSFIVTLGPELFQLLFITALFLVSVFSKKTEETGWIAWASLAGVLIAFAGLGNQGMFFADAYRVDGLSQFFKLAIAIGFCITVFNGKKLPGVEAFKRTDYYFMLALSSWGLMLLSSAVELMTMFIALEISSYSLYSLVSLRKGSKMAAEAAIKYILFGAAATAISLFGLSFTLACAHTSYMAELAGKISMECPIAMIGITMFLISFFYKLAVFPFHFWCPDVYTGTTNETAAFVATLPKLGAVVVLIRITHLVIPGFAMTDVLAILAGLSMTYGNLAALVQKDVKRILGYSSVAHAGYVLIGLVAGTQSGLAAAAFYGLAYVFMNLTCFWVIARIAPEGKNVQLDDLAGMYKYAPAYALTLAVGAFALVGMPPTIGFTGKLFLFTSLWGHGYDWLVILGAINTAFSIFYYLNLVRYAYTKEETGPQTVDATLGSRIMALGLAGIVLVLGCLPSSVYQAALTATQSIWGA